MSPPMCRLKGSLGFSSGKEGTTRSQRFGQRLKQSSLDAWLETIRARALMATTLST